MDKKNTIAGSWMDAKTKHILKASQHQANVYGYNTIARSWMDAKHNKTF
jgi:hypothetical protein